MKYIKLPNFILTALLASAPLYKDISRPIQPGMLTLPVTAKDENSSAYSIIEKDHKKGLVNKRGEVIIPTQYQDLGWSKGALIVMDEVIGYKQNDHWGLLNLSNKKVTAPEFHMLRPFEEDLIVASRRDKYSRQLAFGLINLKGKEVIPFEYYVIEPGNERLIAAVKSRYKVQYGLISRKNKTVIPFQYEKIRLIGEDYYAVYNDTKKAALFDQDGDQLTDFRFDEIGSFKEGLAIVSLYGKKGLIDQEGKLILEPEYKKIRIEGKRVQVLPFRKWEIMNGEREKFGALSFDEVVPLGESVYKVRTGRNEMLVNEKGEMISEVQGWEIERFEHSLAKIKSGNKIGLINKKGDTILDPTYDQIRVFDQILFVKKHSLYGNDWVVTDHQGNKLSPLKYTEMAEPDGGLIPVKRRERWGLISQKGEEIVPCKFDSLHGFYGDVIKVYYLSGFGMIDRDGRWTTRPYLSALEVFENGYTLEQSEQGSSLKNKAGEVLYHTENRLLKHDEQSLIEENRAGQFGLVSLEGKKLLATAYSEISTLQEQAIYTYKKGSDYGIIDVEGTPLMSMTSRFQEMYPVSNEFIGIKADGKYGFVDTQGRLRIANQYDSIGHFSEDMAAIKLLGRWGFVDKSESLKVQPLYDEVAPFKNGLSIVQQKGKFGLVNKKGDLVQETVFDQLVRLDDGKYISQQGDFFGLISEDGRQIAQPKYNSVDTLGNGFVIVERKGQFGLLKTNGVSVIAPIYEALVHDPYSDRYLVSQQAHWKTVKVDLD